MAKGFEKQRLASKIRRELSEILASGVVDVDLPPFFIEKVDLTSDFATARCFIASAVPGEALDEARVLKPLRAAAPKLRSELSRRVRLRRTPEVAFLVDRGKQHQERIETLLANIKKRSGTAVLVVAALLGAAARAEQPSLERFEVEATVMGSSFRVAAYGPEKRRLASVVYAALDEARRVNALLSNYEEDSELSRVNRLAGSRSVEVSEEFAALLDRCLNYSRRTAGAFDVTVGRLMQTWGFFRGNGTMPSRRAVAGALEQVGYRWVRVVGRQVRFLRDGLQLDPGGFGKGYAVERMAALLKRYDIESAMISAGTSTLYALGAPPDEPRGWKAEIRSPDDLGRAAQTLYLRDESLSTSGSYEKFFEVGGVRYSHIMDPRTGRPAPGTAAVSVRADSAMDSEVWTTALFVLGEEWATANAPKNLRVYFCADSGACRWINADFR